MFAKYIKSRNYKKGKLKFFWKFMKATKAKVDIRLQE